MLSDALRILFFRLRLIPLHPKVLTAGIEKEESMFNGLLPEISLFWWTFVTLLVHENAKCQCS